MDLSKILSINGKPGLYELKKERKNGIIVKSLLDDRNQFIALRNNLFSSLEGIEVYSVNLGETKKLPEVFQDMLRLENEGIGTPDVKQLTNDEVRAYFTQVWKDHDPEQVYISHIKKIVKWYDLLSAKNLVDLEPPKTEENDEEE